jgi:hypothetical protein
MEEIRAALLLGMNSFLDKYIFLDAALLPDFLF